MWCDMKKSIPDVPLFDMVMCLSNAFDLMSPVLVDHHRRVAYIASGIGEMLGLSGEAVSDLVIAGLLHDVGAFSLKDRLELAKFEEYSPGNHAEVGYRFAREFKPFEKIAGSIRFHHYPWDFGNGATFKDMSVPIAGHILHLADRIAVLIDPKRPVLGQASRVREKIKSGTGENFVPEFVDAFLELSLKESFWLDSINGAAGQAIEERAGTAGIRLDLDGLDSIARLFSRIIDFRSRFTVVHSSGIAACAKAMAGLAGMSQKDCKRMRIAGYLHDLGKLAVPTEILEKKGKLNVAERNVIKCHTYHTYRVLEPIEGFSELNEWAAYHHERMDGMGYPFHIKGEDLSLGSRIMAVVDTFTAITEDRPYRVGMEPQKVLKLLERMGNNKAFDEDIVSIIIEHFDEVNEVRIAAQAAVKGEYKVFGMPAGAHHAAAG